MDGNWASEEVVSSFDQCLETNFWWSKFFSVGRHDAKWILENPLSLQGLPKIKTIACGELLEMVDYTIGVKKTQGNSAK